MANKELLSVHLAELKFVHEQMHARMAVVSRLITLSATFYVALLMPVIFKFDAIFNSNYFWVFLLATIPFFVLAMLIAREDFLMLSHDLYLFKQLRPAILKLSGEDEKTSETLTFLGKISKYKVGPITMAASIFRYAFPLIGMSTIGLFGIFWFERDENGLYIILMSVGAILFTLFVLYQIGKASEQVNDTLKKEG